MDFSRNPQSGSQHPNGAATAASGSAAGKNKSNVGRLPSWLKIASVVVLFGATVVVVALICLFYFGGNAGSAENGLVNSKEYQAVFLTNGQVYFGNVKDLNTKYVDLTNIYYLQTSSTGTTSSTSSSANNVSLVKLGCELHGPQDEMVINRDQVTFWENLKDDGQVAKAIATYKQQNPNGQNCANSSSSNSTNQAPATTNTNTTTKP